MLRPGTLDDTSWLRPTENRGMLGRIAAVSLALPPTYRLKDKDREKYRAIGESDRFTLKFVKR